MSNLISLDKVAVKSKVKVDRIASDSAVRRKIMDMGIVKGTEIFVKGKAPIGDPIELMVRGYNLSIRKREAKGIIVEEGA